jgi:hypothetical protein
MNFLKSLGRTAKVVIATLGSAAVALCSSTELLSAVITQPWGIVIPLVLPKLIASGAVGGSLFNMQPTKETPKP